VFFDAHLGATALTARDLADLRFFGIAGALCPASDAVAPATAAAIHGAWEDLAGKVVRRLRRGGIAAWAALGVHPRRIPWRGLEALLAELPELLGRPEVVAIGEIGLEEGGPREEEVFARQLAMAKELRLPVLVHTPWKDKGRRTRRILAILREADLPPGRVLVDHADARTVRMIRSFGHAAGVSLSAGGRGRSGPVEEAVRLVASLGPDGLVLDSDAGEGGGDLLGMARAADRMAKAGLSEAVVRRVCGGNALAWLGLSARALLEGGNGWGRGASGRSGRPTSR
jgi:predicted metal-dependent TIM-barrel fold hydrolase